MTLAPAATKNVMINVCSEGDIKIEWDPDNAEEVAIARAQFDALTKSKKDGGKGYTAFRSNADGSQGAKMTQFDPKASKIKLAPMLMGG